MHQLVPAVSSGSILLGMGMDPGRSPRPRLLRLVQEVLQTTLEVAQPRLVWRTGQARAVLEAFPPSRRLSRYLQHADMGAIVAATAGAEMEAQIRKEPDNMKAYVLGAAATAVARATLVQARRLVLQENPETIVADSLSPGTDGLPFKFQLPLLEILPAEAVGISLEEDTLLMKPLASVTAIIAFGRHISEPARLDTCAETLPRCESCHSRGCQLRIKPFQPERASA